MITNHKRISQINAALGSLALVLLTNLPLAHSRASASNEDGTWTHQKHARSRTLQGQEDVQASTSLHSEEEQQFVQRVVAAVTCVVVILFATLIIYFFRMRSRTLKVSRQRRSVKKSPYDKMLSLRNFNVEDWNNKEGSFSSNSPTKVVPYPVDGETSAIAGSLLTLVKIQDTPGEEEKINTISESPSKESINTKLRVVPRKSEPGDALSPAQYHFTPADSPDPMLDRSRSNAMPTDLLVVPFVEPDAYELTDGSSHVPDLPQMRTPNVGKPSTVTDWMQPDGISPQGPPDARGSYGRAKSNVLVDLYTPQSVDIKAADPVMRAVSQRNVYSLSNSKQKTAAEVRVDNFLSSTPGMGETGLRASADKASISFGEPVERFDTSGNQSSPEHIKGKTTPDLKIFTPAPKAEEF